MNIFNEPSAFSGQARLRLLLDWVDLVRLYRDYRRLTLDDVVAVAGFEGREDSVARQAERRYSELVRLASELGVVVHRRKPTLGDDEDVNARWSIVVEDPDALETALSDEFGSPEVEPDPEEPRMGYRKRRVLAGLCAWCRAPVWRPGAWYCARHNDRHRQRLRRSREARLSAGLCGSCAEPLDAPGKTRCRKCLGVEREQAEKRRLIRAKGGRCIVCDTKVRPDEKTCESCADAIRARVRKRVGRLKAAATCVSCGVRPIAVGRSVQYCSECSDRLAEAERRRRTTDEAYRQKRQEHLRAYRQRLAEKGLCQRCGKGPLGAGMKTCRACLDKLKAKKTGAPVA